MSVRKEPLIKSHGNDNENEEFSSKGSSLKQSIVKHDNAESPEIRKEDKELLEIDERPETINERGF